MNRSRLLVLAASFVAVIAAPRPAGADITAFLGFSPTVASRTAVGVAAGGGLLVVGFEFEYSSISEDSESLAPGLRTGMANIVLQTPIPVAGIQFYATAGGGFYSERLGVASEKNFAANVGGGVKIRLAGPLRVRLDYRVFKLQGSPVENRYHRLYAGINIGF